MLCKCTRPSVEVGEVLIVGPPPLYLNMAAEWLSGDNSQMIAWSTTNNSDLIYHLAGLENPAEFTESNYRAEWGTLYYAMKSVSDNSVICISFFQVNSLG
jgi:hypothetical protein